VLVRAGLERIIAAEPELALVGSCADLDSLLVLVDELRPDVVLAEISLPPLHTDEGIRLAAELRTRQPGTGVVILSQQASPDHARALLAEGADRRGYLLKDRIADATELTTVLRQIAAGGSHLDPTLFDLILADPNGNAAQRLKPLTPRELEVLTLISAGHSNSAIARQLSISTRAVERHTSSIYNKLEFGPPNHTSRRVKATLTYLQTRTRGNGHPLGTTD